MGQKSRSPFMNGRGPYGMFPGLQQKQIQAQQKKQQAAYNKQFQTDLTKASSDFQSQFDPQTGLFKGNASGTFAALNPTYKISAAQQQSRFNPMQSLYGFNKNSRLQGGATSYNPWSSTGSQLLPGLNYGKLTNALPVGDLNKFQMSNFYNQPESVKNANYGQGDLYNANMMAYQQLAQNNQLGQFMDPQTGYYQGGSFVDKWKSLGK